MTKHQAQSGHLRIMYTILLCLLACQYPAHAPDMYSMPCLIQFRAAMSVIHHFACASLACTNRSLNTQNSHTMGLFMVLPQHPLALPSFANHGRPGNRKRMHGHHRWCQCHSCIAAKRELGPGRRDSLMTVCLVVKHAVIRAPWGSCNAINALQKLPPLGFARTCQIVLRYTTA